MNENKIPTWLFRLMGWIIIANIALVIITSGALSNPWAYVIMAVVFFMARNYNKRFPHTKIVTHESRQYEEVQGELLKRYRPIDETTRP